MPPRKTRRSDRLLSDLLIFSIFLPSPISCGGGDSRRDVVPPSRDVIADAAASTETQEGYEYVARRPLAVVALAEARGIDPGVARAAINHLADALDACATEQVRAGARAEGAARIVAQIDDGGSVSATKVRVDPGAGNAQSVLRCLVAPTKLLTFPLGDAGARGIAIEALWGHAGAR